MQKTIFWTDDKIETMRRMALKGFSSSEIGAVLQCTRNAVIGKMHRMRFAFTQKPQVRPIPKPKPSFAPVDTGIASRSHRNSPVAAKNDVTATRVAKTVKKPQNTVPVNTLAGKECSILDVTGCRWPVKNDHSVIGGFWFCNAELHDSRYCERHCQVSGATYSPDLIRKTTESALKAYKKAS